MFHFVDQILELDPRCHALGLKHVTTGDAFVRASASGRSVLLPSIIGEALGQLGAWNVMAANDFTLRPVAGVVGAVTILGQAAVGDTILLDTTIDSVTDDAVFYHAAASVADTVILRLEDTLGPLLPMEEFNDPEELRQRFACIHRPSSVGGLPQGGGKRVPPFDPSFDEILSMRPGEEATAVSVLRGDEGFLADHFPNKPVLPLSLLLESILDLGRELLGDRALTPIAARKVKMSRFVEPGSRLLANLRVVDRSDERAVLRFRCEVDGVRACVGEATFSSGVGGTE
ncbi:MAG: hydroxymyristoyl-ACP dehydratase [Acidobacteriota bacterium]